MGRQHWDTSAVTHPCTTTGQQHWVEGTARTTSRQHRQDCLFSKVIHRRLFLSWKVAWWALYCCHWRWGKSLPVPIHSAQWTQISSWLQWKMWLATGFLSIELEYWAFLTFRSRQITRDLLEKCSCPLLQIGHSQIAKFPTVIHC